MGRYLACVACFLDRYLAGRNGPGLTCDVGTAAPVGERAHAGGRKVRMPDRVTLPDPVAQTCDLSSHLHLVTGQRES